ncbi:MAG: response regulator [Acidobacteriota bacterium]|nr:response regulator [Acidobacteriota bacterium]
MPKKILLADDSITIQKVVELTFSDGDYEVTAVNNGAKAIQKLAEMRPDIILSDIIMPEKNGYEVCEYVKSHPEYRNIPVVLLTGTFEPFDPDRAEKAGCDAVVTKPFESQSLIHKVEELIAQAQSGGSPAPAPAAPPPAETGSPWMDDVTTNMRESSSPSPSSSFSTASGGFPAATPQAFTHDADVFAAPEPVEATTEMPFEIPATPAFADVPSFDAPSFNSGAEPFDEPAAPEFGGETRAFPRMTFEEMQRMAGETPASAPAPEPTPAPEPSPWDEPAALGGETRAFTKMSFDDFQAPPPAPEPYNNETRAFQRVSLEEMQRMAAADEAAEQSAAPEPVAEVPAVSPWDEPEAPAMGGETPEAPVEASWDQPAFSTEPEPPAFASDAASPFANEDAPAFGGETRAFPKMSFEDFQQMAAPAPDPQPEPQVAQPSSWDGSSAASASPFDDAAPSPFAAEPAAFEEELPATAAWSLPTEPAVEAEPADEAPLSLTSQPMPEDMPFAEEEAPAEPVWSLDSQESAAAEAEPAAYEEPAAEAPIPIAARSEGPALPSDLTDEQVDRIARRVVELISDQVVRNIAWEVIPDLAEMVVKERIRQLEAEA